MKNKNLLKNFSLVPVSLRRKLLITFSLMSIIPLLVAVYLTTTYTFPIRDNVWNITLIILSGVFIASLGFYLARSIINAVIGLSNTAKKVAGGALEQVIEVKRKDEIGDLESSLQTITQRLRENMKEIQLYGEKVRGVNIEISNKVMALSSLLQIGNVMASSTNLDTILPLVLDKISQSTLFKRIFLMLLDRKTNDLITKFSHNIDSKELQKRKVKLNEQFLGKIAAKTERLVIDSSVKLTKEMQSFIDTYKINNACFSPIISRGQCIGLLVMGNNLTDFVFQKDNLELINIFTRQITIAIENDWLVKKTAELSLKDELTGLYNESYIKDRLKEEIKRAIMHQRPCSFSIFNIDDFKVYKRNNSELAGESILKKIATILRENISEVDKAARSAEDTFSIVLPEKNRGEAVKVAEKIRKTVEKFQFPGENKQPAGRLTISAGVSANPINGLSAEDLINVASTALKKAKKEGKNRVIV